MIDFLFCIGGLALAFHAFISGSFSVSCIIEAASKTEGRTRLDSRVNRWLLLALPLSKIFYESLAEAITPQNKIRGQDCRSHFFSIHGGAGHAGFDGQR